MFSCINRSKALIPLALALALLSSSAFAGPGGLSCAASEPLVADPWFVYQGDTQNNQDNTQMYGPIFSPGNDAYYTFTVDSGLIGTLVLDAQYDAAIYLTDSCSAVIPGSSLLNGVAADPGHEGYLDLEDDAGNPLSPGTYYLIVTGDPNGIPGAENGPFSFSVYYQTIYVDGFDP